MEEKKEKEEMGFDEIVWTTPKTVEEVELVLDAIQRSNKAQQKAEETSIDEENSNFVQNDSAEIEFLKKFEGVDLSKLGEE